MNMKVFFEFLLHNVCITSDYVSNTCQLCLASQNVKFEVCNILFLTQNVVAKIKTVTSEEPSSSSVGSLTADKSTQCSTHTIARRKDWDNIFASTLYARKNSVVNMLVDIIKAVSN